MSAEGPEAIYGLLKNLFRAGDLEGLVALYEPDAAMVANPGQTVHGAPRIREVFKSFLALNGQYELDAPHVVRSGELALLSAGWSFSATDPEGNPLELGGTTADVVRLQPDGTWRYVIDNPWGPEAWSEDA